MLFKRTILLTTSISLAIILFDLGDAKANWPVTATLHSRKSMVFHNRSALSLKVFVKDENGLIRQSFFLEPNARATLHSDKFTKKLVRSLKVSCIYDYETYRYDLDSIERTIHRRAMIDAFWKGVFWLFWGSTGSDVYDLITIIQRGSLDDVTYELQRKIALNVADFLGRKVGEATGEYLGEMSGGEWTGHLWRGLLGYGTAQIARNAMEDYLKTRGMAERDRNTDLIKRADLALAALTDRGFETRYTYQLSKATSNMFLLGRQMPIILAHFGGAQSLAATANDEQGNPAWKAEADTYGAPRYFRLAIPLGAESESRALLAYRGFYINAFYSQEHQIARRPVFVGDAYLAQPVGANSYQVQGATFMSLNHYGGGLTYNFMSRRANWKPYTIVSIGAGVTAVHGKMLFLSGRTTNGRAITKESLNTLSLARPAPYIDLNINPFIQNLPFLGFSLGARYIFSKNWEFKEGYELYQNANLDKLTLPNGLLTYHFALAAKF